MKIIDLIKETAKDNGIDFDIFIDELVHEWHQYVMESSNHSSTLTVELHDFAQRLGGLP